MHRDRVVTTWLIGGLSDLLFAFHNDETAFEANSRFSEIVGLEKILKATLLYHRHAEYETLSLHDSRAMINRIAKKYAHEFADMLKELSARGVSEIEAIRREDFDGYAGERLIEALKSGYMETRYPVPQPISDSFPIGLSGWTQDPLCSSGMTNFTYALSNACISHLSCSVDLTSLRSRFQERFAELESLERFNNLFWGARR